MGPGRDDLPGLPLFLWALVPRWVFYLTILAMIGIVGGLVWYATKKHQSLWGALKAGASSCREVHEAWETDQ